MRTLNLSFARNAIRVFGISFTLIMILSLGCSHGEGFLPDMTDIPESTLKSAALISESYVLSGTTHFPAYAVKEHTVVSPWDMNMLICQATLTIEGHDMTLTTEEFFGPIHFRTITFHGKITPGGSVKFAWPESWYEFGVEQTRDVMGETVTLHTGCIQYGPGTANEEFCLYYKGRFDGNEFYADAHFMGKQVQFGTVPFYSEAVLGELIEGPVQFNFSIELLVADPSE